MPGDEARGSDDELLSQIDELKARMDRLMKGGTSTSNSALLTDAPKKRNPEKVEPQSTPTPPPPRSKVRDLIGTEEKEILEDLPGLEDPVPFPEEAAAADEGRPADRPAEDRPSSPPPPSKPKPAAVEGSIIAVDDNRNEPRPKVSSFEDLGSAIEEELARDNSVPPATAKKGPDLASRFGPGDSKGASEASNGSQPEQEPEQEPDAEPAGPAEPEDAPEQDEYVEHVAAIGVPDARSHVGAIVAIWVFTAVTSGTIATLHFTGII